MGRDFDHLQNEMSLNAEAERSQDVCDMSSLRTFQAHTSL